MDTGLHSLFLEVDCCCPLNEVQGNDATQGLAPFHLDFSGPTSLPRRGLNQWLCVADAALCFAVFDMCPHNK